MLPAGSKNSSAAEDTHPAQRICEQNLTLNPSEHTAQEGLRPAMLPRAGISAGHSGRNEKDRPQVAHEPRGVYALPITILMVVWRAWVRVWPVSHSKDSGVGGALKAGTAGLRAGAIRDRP